MESRRTDSRPRPCEAARIAEVLLSEHLPEVTDGHELHVDGIGIERGNVHLLIGDRASAGSMSSRTGQPPRVLKARSRWYRHQCRPS